MSRQYDVPRVRGRKAERREEKRKRKRKRKRKVEQRKRKIKEWRQRAHMIERTKQERVAGKTTNADIIQDTVIPSRGFWYIFAALSKRVWRLCSLFSISFLCSWRKKDRSVNLSIYPPVNVVCV